MSRNYWGYYDFPRAAPRPKAALGKERKNFGNTWWGKKWVEILSKYEDDQRMARGRAYARADKVKKFKINEGAITAMVEGSLGDYNVSVKFKKYNEKEWLKIIKKLNETPIILGSLLNNEMPQNIDEHIGNPLIPSSFDSKCSCPDYANPCKHIAAVFYTLADEIDYDPMLLFKIAGMSKENILKKIGALENTDKSDIKERKTKRIKKGKKNKKPNRTIAEGFIKPQIGNDNKGRAVQVLNPVVRNKIGKKDLIKNKTKNIKSKHKNKTPKING